MTSEKEWRVFKKFLHSDKVKDLNRIEWSNNLKKILIHNSYDSEIESVYWPNSIETLQFGSNFNHPIDNVKWPQSLKTLIFGNNFNQLVENTKWPKSLNVVQFGSKFNQRITNETWPENTILILHSANEITVNNLPNNLKHLKVMNLNCPLTNLPISLEKLDILYDENNYLEESKIPFGCEINKIQK
jgi:hypothetical protein